MSKVYTEKVRSQIGPDGENVFIKLPDELLKNLGWQEGDYIEVDAVEDSLTMKKAKMVDLEINLSEEEYETLELAALKKGTTVENFIMDCLEKLK